MKRTILIHTFGGLLLGLLLFTMGNETLNATFPSVIIPLWGVFGAVLLYESLRPYFPSLHRGHMVALCVIWGLALLGTIVFAPFVVGVPGTMFVLMSVMPCRSVLRWLAVTLSTSTVFFFGLAHLFQTYMSYRSGAPSDFSTVVSTALLGAVFGWGVHIAAHWLQLHPFGHATRKPKPHRDQFFLTDAELSANRDSL